jgi:hypothetical protein
MSSQIQMLMPVLSRRNPEHFQRGHFMFWLFHALIVVRARPGLPEGGDKPRHHANTLRP